MVSMGGPTRRRGTRSASCRGGAGGGSRSALAGDRPATTIFNFHAPPYGAGLDEAPALDDDMNIKAGGQALRPVGSTSVKAAIERVQPMLGLHGHIHESKGATRIGKTLSLNPGSSYEEGVLQAAVVTIDPKKRKVKNYQLVNG